MGYLEIRETMTGETVQERETRDVRLFKVGEVPVEVSMPRVGRFAVSQDMPGIVTVGAVELIEGTHIHLGTRNKGDDLDTRILSGHDYLTITNGGWLVTMRVREDIPEGVVVPLPNRTLKEERRPETVESGGNLVETSSR